MGRRTSKNVNVFNNHSRDNDCAIEAFLLARPLTFHCYRISLSGNDQFRTIRHTKSSQAQSASIQTGHILTLRINGIRHNHLSMHMISGHKHLMQPVTFILCILLAGQLAAQPAPPGEKEGYAQVIAKRAAKIVETLHVKDAAFNSQVQNIIIDQYYNLSITHDARNSQIKAIREGKSELTQTEKDHIARIENTAQQHLTELHKQFLSKLGKLCTPQQIEIIKDGMTYGVLQVTYKAYQDMLPNLTEEQKKQILAWLTEAREQAMDAESSEKKHAVFGKYKGRINNYLSAAGIDMKKAEEEWRERRKSASN